MHFNKMSPLIFLIFASLLILFSNSAISCTGLQLKAKDGSFINGRTVEFGIPLDLEGIVVPRNYEFNGTLSDGRKGLHYFSKYAVVGATAFNAPAVVDGVNEKGLSAGMFYFPGYASYMKVTSDNEARALAPTEFVNWVLTQFSSVNEVKAAVDSIVIAQVSLKAWGGIPPFHYIVYDKSGKSIVIEPMNEKLMVMDDPIGVITNSPDFTWHMTNLSNFINLSPFNAPTQRIDGYTLQQFGQGSGLHGMPGDFSPPSRFVRAAIYSTTAIPAKSANEAVLHLFHILNQFDIPVGAVRADHSGKITAEYTLATTVKDPSSTKYYFRTFEDQAIKFIDLKSFDMDAKELMAIKFKSPQPLVDVSKTATIKVSSN